MNSPSNRLSRNLKIVSQNQIIQINKKSSNNLQGENNVVYNKEIECSKPNINENTSQPHVSSINSLINSNTETDKESKISVLKKESPKVCSENDIEPQNQDNEYSNFTKELEKKLNNLKNKKVYDSLETVNQIKELNDTLSQKESLLLRLIQENKNLISKFQEIEKQLDERLVYNISPKRKKKKSNPSENSLNKYVKIKNNLINKSLQIEENYRLEADKQIEKLKEYYSNENSIKKLILRSNELNQKILSYNEKIELLRNIKKTHDNICSKAINDKMELLYKYRNDYKHLVLTFNKNRENDLLLRKKQSLINNHSLKLPCQYHKDKKLLCSKIYNIECLSPTTQRNSSIRNLRNKLKPLWDEFNHVNDNNSKSKSKKIMHNRVLSNDLNYISGSNSNTNNCFSSNTTTNRNESCSLLFIDEEKRILNKLLPQKIINKYEKKYEVNDKMKSAIEVKFNNDFTGKRKEINLNKNKILDIKDQLKKEKFTKIQKQSESIKLRRQIKDLNNKINDIITEINKQKLNYTSKLYENQKLKINCNDMLIYLGESAEYDIEKVKEKLQKASELKFKINKNKNLKKINLKNKKSSKYNLNDSNLDKDADYLLEHFNDYLEDQNQNYKIFNGLKFTKDELSPIKESSIRINANLNESNQNNNLTKSKEVNSDNSNNDVVSADENLYISPITDNNYNECIPDNRRVFSIENSVQIETESSYKNGKVRKSDYFNNTGNRSIFGHRRKSIRSDIGYRLKSQFK